MYPLALFLVHLEYTLWASCQIRKFAGCACAGNAGNVFPATLCLQSRHASRHVRDARAVMHVGIANWRFPLMSVAGKTFPAFPAHAQPAIYASGKRSIVISISLSSSLTSWLLYEFTTMRCKLMFSVVVHITARVCYATVCYCLEWINLSPARHTSYVYQP